MINLQSVMDGIKNNDLVVRINETNINMISEKITISVDFYAYNNYIVTVDFYTDYNGALTDIVCWHGDTVLFDTTYDMTDAQINFIEKLLGGTL